MATIGVASVDITPGFPVLLNGFNNPARGEGPAEVIQRIRASALAFTGAEGTSVLLTVDSCAIPRSVTTAVREALAASHQLAPERVAICFTHSHATPALTGAIPKIPETLCRAVTTCNWEAARANIDRYTAELTSRLVEVAGSALSDRREGALAWTQGRVKFGFHRNLKSAADKDLPAREGPLDHDLAVLKVTDAAGTLRALLASYACHPVSITDNRVSGDWPGHARAQLEAAFPGVKALVATGCAGDINPTDTVAGQGAQVADCVKALVRDGRWTPAAPPAECLLRTVALPYADGSGTMAYPVQTWRFGGLLTMVFLAGEPLSDFGLYLKGEFGAAPLWVNGYANEADPGYVLPPRFAEHPDFSYPAAANVDWYALPARYARTAGTGLANALVQALDLRWLLVADDLLYTTGSEGIVLWRRHLGQAQGTSSWSRTRGVACGWNRYRKLVSAGGGIFYGVDDEGDVYWHRHLGHGQGAAEWEERKRVQGGWLQYKHILSPGGGIVYGILPNGDLEWWRHDGQADGTARWTGPRVVGTDWTGFKHVFVAPPNYFYGVLPNGDLMWLRHDGIQDGTFLWKGQEKVGDEWFKYVGLSAGRGGTIYGLNPDGSLDWWRHDGQAAGQRLWTGPRRVLGAL